MVMTNMISSMLERSEIDELSAKYRVFLSITSLMLDILWSWLFFKLLVHLCIFAKPVLH